MSQTTQPFIELWSESTGLGEAIPTSGLIFSESDSVIPDVVWVSFRQEVELYRRIDNKLTLIAALGNTDTVASPLLPDFSCPVSCLFR